MHEALKVYLIQYKELVLPQIGTLGIKKTRSFINEQELLEPPDFYFTWDSRNKQLKLKFIHFIATYFQCSLDKAEQKINALVSDMLEQLHDHKEYSIQGVVKIQVSGRFFHISPLDHFLVEMPMIIKETPYLVALKKSTKLEILQKEKIAKTISLQEGGEASSSILGTTTDKSSNTNTLTEERDLDQDRNDDYSHEERLILHAKQPSWLWMVVVLLILLGLYVMVNAIVERGLQGLMLGSDF